MINEKIASDSLNNPKRSTSILNEIGKTMGKDVAVGFKWGSMRARSWRTPPNWSFSDWCDELLGIAIWSAWEAKQDYDPSHGISLAEFVSSRIKARTLTRYRQEWRYAQSTISSDAEIIECVIPANPSTHFSQTAFEILKQALEQLSGQERWLLDQIFWQHYTETEIAAKLQISQPAVNKRKRVALLHLRDLL
jgi:RNA polymerase sigma factor (sigma-70 family)